MTVYAKAIIPLARTEYGRPIRGLDVDRPTAIGRPRHRRYQNNSNGNEVPTADMFVIMKILLY